MTCCDFVNLASDLLLYNLIVSPISLREVVLAPIVKGDLERRQTSDVRLGPDGDPREYASRDGFVCGVKEGLSWEYVHELVKVLRVRIIC